MSDEVFFKNIPAEPPLSTREEEWGQWSNS